MSTSSIADMKAEALHEEVSAVEGLLQRGHEIEREEKELGVLVNARTHWRAILIASTSFTSALVFGYDTVVNGASISMPAFLLYFGEIGPTGPYLPSIWTSLWTAMSSLTQAIGAIIIGLIIDRLGRKWPAVASALLTLVGTAIQFVAQARGTLMAGKMISGFGVGALLSIGTTYAGEIVPLKLRAPVQTCLVVAIIFTQGLALGIIRIFVPNPAESSFRKVFAIQWAVGALSAVAWALTPESPVWLVTRDRIAEARKIVHKIFGSNSPDERLEVMVQTVRLEANQRENSTTSYSECFQKHNMKRTITVLFLYSTSNIGGAAFLAQNIYFLITAGLAPIHAFDIGIGGFGLAILIIFASGAYLRKISRRNTVLAGLVICFVTLSIVGGLYWAPGTGPLWAIAVLMNILISVQSSTLQGAGWPIAAETPSVRLRAKTISIGIFGQAVTTWFFVFVTPYMYNVDSGDLGARTGFIYAGTNILLFVTAWFLVPDTTGLTAEAIDAAYEAEIAPRKFVRHSNEIHA